MNIRSSDFYTMINGWKFKTHNPHDFLPYAIHWRDFNVTYNYFTDGTWKEQPLTNEQFLCTPHIEQSYLYSPMVSFGREIFDADVILTTKVVIYNSYYYQQRSASWMGHNGYILKQETFCDSDECIVWDKPLFNTIDKEIDINLLHKALGVMKDINMIWHSDTGIVCSTRDIGKQRNVRL